MFSESYERLVLVLKMRKIIKRNDIVAVNGHNHTKVSDGKLNSCELLILNILCGFKKVFVTDHNDLVWGGKEKFCAKFISKLIGTEFCPGIEFSCFFDLSDFGGNNKTEFHIVGLGVDPQNVGVKETIKKIQSGREDITRRILENIRRVGFSIISFDELKEKSGGNITLPDIARNVREKDGGSVDAEDFIREHLSRGSDCFVSNDTLISSADAIEIIKEAGGFPVWGHPKDSLGDFFDTHFEQVGSVLREMEIGGIEAFRDNHSACDVRKIEKFCIDNDLEIRAGSDMHEARDLFSYMRNIIKVLEDGDL